MFSIYESFFFLFSFFVELKTIQVYKSTIYIYIYILILISKAERKSNENLNWNLIKV